MSRSRIKTPPSWALDILHAHRLANQEPLERRLTAFLTALTAETLSLVAAESEEGAEALTLATICVGALFAGPCFINSDEEFHKWSSQVHCVLILESLQRRGYLQLNRGDGVRDPSTDDIPIHMSAVFLECFRR